MKPVLQWIAAVAFVLFACGISGRMGYQDALREHLAYCEGVRLGDHPDYNGNAKTICKPAELKRIRNELE